PITCSPDDLAQEVLGKMACHHVGELPVVDKGEVIGLVSMADLIQALYDQAEAENEHLAAYLYGPG
ncbi:MAG: cyclic nucleotide-binding/CBS domain-containing protein, partial [Isosphaeraceae bacterium]